MNNRLPSGAKVSLLKNDVKVSLAYMLEFLTPSPARTLGDGISIGLTAGNGKEGTGEAERRIDGEEPNDERRLWDTGGGSMGRFDANGVPGVEGTGEIAIGLLVAG